MISNAVLSDDRTHRYQLSRIWDDGLPKILFIGLNPSRADESYNDLTITKCIEFAKRWECYGGIYFGNLYSFRTPYPEELIRNLSIAANPDTDTNLFEMAKYSHICVCAWGSWKFIDYRKRQVLKLLNGEVTTYCFGLTKDGSHKHPCRLGYKTPIVKYQP